MSESVVWGEAPKFPDFRDRYDWARNNERLTPEECRAVLTRVTTLLVERYEMIGSDLEPWIICDGCGYPMPSGPGHPGTVCADCTNQD